MIDLTSWLSDLTARDIQISCEGDQLRINAPKGAMNADIQQEIKSRKAQLLAYFQKQKVISPVSRGGDLALSYAQKRLWFMDQFEKDSPAYNMPSAIRFKGDLNTVALEQALNEIMRRHETLRTSFPVKNGDPVQDIKDHQTINLEPVDLCGFEAEHLPDHIDGLIQIEVLKPFNLQEGPLIRGQLLKCGPRDHILLLTMHHIVSDGWSIGVLGQELSTLYQAYDEGESSPLSDLKLQYVDFAKWQEQWLKGDEYKRQLSYWSDLLTDASKILELPCDYSRPPVQTFEGRTETVYLEKETTDQLYDLARQNGATIYMPLLAAYGILLKSFTGQDDVIIGSPIANRNRPEVEDIIGFFANTLPLRVDMRGEVSFKELLKRVQRKTIEAFENQDVPFEKIVENLKVDRDLSRNPLAQVVFVLQNSPFHASGSVKVGLKGLSLEPIAFETGTVRMDMEVHVWEEPDRLKIEFIYNKALFSDKTIQRMAANYQAILRSIVKDTDQKLSKIESLSVSEKQLLLEDWNATDQGFDVDRSIVHSIVEHAQTRGNCVALSCLGEQLTYQELDERSNSLARTLQKQGIGKGKMVGVCLHRSNDLIVALSAVMKTGAAYVPIDPTYPRDRVLFLLEDSEAPILITQQAVYDSIGLEQLDLSSDVLKLDDPETSWQDESKAALDVNIKGDDLAYMIYTSGSTGRPKGVQIRHKTVINLFKGVHPRLNVTSEDAWTVFHSYAFDLSVWEIWSPLFAGGKLVIVPYEMTMDPARFSQYLLEEEVTVLNQTPSFMRQLTLLDDFSQTLQQSDLRLIICGGEALSQELAEELMDFDVSVWNFYGPTEATVWCLITEVEKGKSDSPIVSIGAPIANAKAYVLDEDLNPVPIGCVGELHIGGDCLAVGYFKRAELSSERFIPDPFSTEKEARLYKTGDLVRWREHGEVEYIARMDTQVKLRGFRVELGEIEQALSAISGIDQSVVIVREDTPGDQRLCAYLVEENQGNMPTEQQIREYLKAELPSYMVPASFLKLDQLPLTPNGKIDRKDLPKPEGKQLSGTKGSMTNARNKTEELISRIWCEEIGLSEVGVEDNFFDVGGYSFLMVKIINRLNEALGRNLDVVDMFQHPTISNLAAFVEQDGSENSNSNTFNQLNARASKRKQGLASRQRRNKQRKGSNPQ